MTDAEKLMWSRIRGKQLKGLQFYRQKIIGSYYYYVKFSLTLSNTLVYPLGYGNPRDRTIPVEAGGLLG